MRYFFALTLAFAAGLTALAEDAAPKNPRFSIDYLDRSVSPGTNFYEFAAGQWRKDNPIPADKARWAGFTELSERNWFAIHQILDETVQADAAPRSPRYQIGKFYIAAMDTNRIEKLGLKPIQSDLKRIDRIKSTRDLFALLAEFHDEGIGGLFGADFSPDEKDSTIYAVHLGQGGLSLPDRDYYLKDSFAEIRDKYRLHLEKMFSLLGEKPADAATNAVTVFSLETELAKAGRTRVELREADKNYTKFTTAELLAKYPNLPWADYFSARKIDAPKYEIVGQPEFFDALNRLMQERPLADWKIYLRWHLLHGSATFLPPAFDQENFAFFGKTLSGQPQQEPRWKRTAHVLDGTLGEALGQLYVEKCFPPEARARMLELVQNLKAVYRDRLATVPWMTEPTRIKALAKFDRFTQKIGHPDTFRDYSSIDIRPDDYLGDVRRSSIFESRRESARVGKTVDRTEWDMTPETVNAYCNQQQNEIVFPAGILQPPFFDVTLDDAVNYGAIGVVIGHEMTHAFDDQGRKFDADGNLNDWWSPADAQAFETRAQKLVDEFNGFEALPGMHVNGKLTLGENLADLGGVSIAYEALQRDLAKDPSRRKTIDGFTPEQRFFLSFAQVWRINIREAEARRLVTVDPHSPGEFRANGSLMNSQEFLDAFGIQPGMPMWEAPDKRAKVW
ncbi:MAG TPA: M13 family metallopeptidase [Verrucomicrobiae bacterium]|nr:M13 family metallopeptidase [Verrucomicrobiae bacterium]